MVLSILAVSKLQKQIIYHSIILPLQAHMQQHLTSYHPVIGIILQGQFQVMQFPYMSMELYKEPIPSHHILTQH